MHILIENVLDGETIPHPMLLITGRIKNTYQEDKIESGSTKEDEKEEVFINHESCSLERRVVSHSLPLRHSRFKFLVELLFGKNVLNFEYKGVLKTLTLFFPKESLDVKKTVRVVYIVPRDSDGSFQAPPLQCNSPELACQKISLALGLTQCFISDSLHSHGLGRKSFVVPSPCEIFHSKISMEESHAQSESSLWEYHAKELLAKGVANEDTKVLALLSATRFVNTLGRPPKDHSEMMSLTKSHGALGGGGLAMFGSGCLYTWPTHLHEVQEAFLNATVVDSLNFMDDSGYRHNYGACFSTTLGAIIHELGHAFDLGHTENGIMARGFDDLLRYFTIQEKSETLGFELPSITKGEDFSNVSEDTLLSPKQDTRFTNLKKPNGASYLQAYQTKKELRRMVEDSGKAFWSRSCALILSAHSWFNPLPKSMANNERVIPQLTMAGGILRVSIEDFGKVIVVELRKNDRVLGFVEVPPGHSLTPSSPTTSKSIWEFSIHKIIDKFPDTNEIVVATSTGYIWKCNYPMT